MDLQQRYAKYHFYPKPTITAWELAQVMIRQLHAGGVSPDVVAALPDDLRQHFAIHQLGNGGNGEKS